jgi:hypothetical protein
VRKKRSLGYVALLQSRTKALSSQFIRLKQAAGSEQTDAVRDPSSRAATTPVRFRRYRMSEGAQVRRVRFEEAAQTTQACREHCSPTRRPLATSQGGFPSRLQCGRASSKGLKARPTSSPTWGARRRGNESPRSRGLDQGQPRLGRLHLLRRGGARSLRLTMAPGSSRSWRRASRRGGVVALIGRAPPPTRLPPRLRKHGTSSSPD